MPASPEERCGAGSSGTPGRLLRPSDRALAELWAPASWRRCSRRRSSCRRSPPSPGASAPCCSRPNPEPSTRCAARRFSGCHSSIRSFSAVRATATGPDRGTTTRWPRPGRARSPPRWRSRRRWSHRVSSAASFSAAWWRSPWRTGCRRSISSPTPSPVWRRPPPVDCACSGRLSWRSPPRTRWATSGARADCASPLPCCCSPWRCSWRAASPTRLAAPDCQPPPRSRPPMSRPSGGARRCGARRGLSGPSPAARPGAVRRPRCRRASPGRRALPSLGRRTPGRPPVAVRRSMARVDSAHGERVTAFGGRLLPYEPVRFGLADPRGFDPLRPAASLQLLRQRLHRPARVGLSPRPAGGRRGTAARSPRRGLRARSPGARGDPGLARSGEDRRHHPAAQRRGPAAGLRPGRGRRHQRSRSSAGAGCHRRPAGASRAHRDGERRRCVELSGAGAGDAGGGGDWRERRRSRSDDRAARQRHEDPPQRRRISGPARHQHQFHARLERRIVHLRSATLPGRRCFSGARRRRRDERRRTALPSTVVDRDPGRSSRAESRAP